MNVIFCPRKVDSPCELPTGDKIPVGNGLESVADGAKLLLGTMSVVVWLKPSWSTSGFYEYVPFSPRLATVIGDTKSPNPPRITVLLCSAEGLHAKPTRGLKMWDA
jgi:hypothetical protein